MVCFALTAVVCVYGLAKLRKLQRVRMWGESGVGGTSLAPISPRHSILHIHRNWRADSIEPVWGSLPGEARSERIKRLRENAFAAAAATASRFPDAASATATTSGFEDAPNDKEDRKKPGPAADSGVDSKVSI